MKILAIDSSSTVRSVALCQRVDDQIQVLAAAESPAERGGRFASLIEEVLGEVSTAEVDQLVVGVGPGSAAGIRSTLAFAQGWGTAMDIQVLGVSSAWAVAVEAGLIGLEGKLQVVLPGPARMFYLGDFPSKLGNSVQPCSPLALVGKGELLSNLNCMGFVVGEGVPFLFRPGSSDRDEVSGLQVKEVYPSARALATVAGTGGRKAQLPLEPFSLITPSFVKAPPPRAIPPSARVSDAS